MRAAWDGIGWQALGEGPGGSIEALTNHAGARWNGSTWQPAGAGVTGTQTFNAPTVLALTVFGTQLVASGQFSNMQSIAAWDGTSWSPLGSGLQRSGSYGKVAALTVVGTDLYAGGIFDHRRHDRK